MQGIFSLDPSYRTIETCNLLDIWSDWWGNMTWPTKRQKQKQWQTYFENTSKERSVWLLTRGTRVSPRYLELWQGIRTSYCNPFSSLVECYLVSNWSRALRVSKPLPNQIFWTLNVHEKTEQCCTLLWTSWCRSRCRCTSTGTTPAFNSRILSRFSSCLKLNILLGHKGRGSS